jgi:ORF6N domain
MPKKPAANEGIIPFEVVEQEIFVLRGHRVMLDRDLAELYGVPVKRLNEQVKRNNDRFPEDFMFQLTLEEGRAVLLSRSQFATLKRGGNIKYRPYAFTEHGAVMLANVLRSPVAVRASIQVVRAFVHLRQMLASHEDLGRKIEAIERKVGKHDADLAAILKVLRKLLEPAPVPPKDMLAGRQREIHAERDRKLEAARKQRQIRRQQAA